MTVFPANRCTITAILALGFLGIGGCLDIPGPPDGPQDPSCLEHAVFGPPLNSLYVLPYAIGSAYKVFQTYCGPVSHGKDGQMSIDFLMPVGTEVLAARSGTVRRVIDQYKDYGRRINYIYIEHKDGTAAFYAHLQQGSAEVAIGDTVAAGQVIALSGASGTSLAHLHFGVARTWPVRHPDDLPVNFRNADGPLDERGGLKRGIVYKALPGRDDQ